MSETWPFTLWSGSAPAESCANPSPRARRGFQAEWGKDVESLSHRALPVRNSGSGCYRRGRGHQPGPGGDEDAEASEKSTERGVVGCQAQEKCASKFGSQRALGQAQLSLHFCHDPPSIPPTPFYQSAPFLARPGVGGSRNGGMESRK